VFPVAGWIDFPPSLLYIGLCFHSTDCGKIHLVNGLDHLLVDCSHGGNRFIKNAFWGFVRSIPKW